MQAVYWFYLFEQHHTSASVAPSTNPSEQQNCFGSCCSFFLFHFLWDFHVTYPIRLNIPLHFSTLNNTFQLFGFYSTFHVRKGKGAVCGTDLLVRLQCRSFHKFIHLLETVLLTYIFRNVMPASVLPFARTLFSKHLLRRVISLVMSSSNFRAVAFALRGAYLVLFLLQMSYVSIQLVVICVRWCIKERLFRTHSIDMWACSRYSVRHCSTLTCTSLLVGLWYFCQRSSRTYNNARMHARNVGVRVSVSQWAQNTHPSFGHGRCHSPRLYFTHRMMRIEQLSSYPIKVDTRKLWAPLRTKLKVSNLATCLKCDKWQVISEGVCTIE